MHALLAPGAVVGNVQPLDRKMAQSSSMSTPNFYTRPLAHPVKPASPAQEGHLVLIPDQVVNCIGEFIVSR